MVERRKIIREIWHTLSFCVLFVPYLIIDLYRITTEVTEWERKGINEYKKKDVLL